MKINQLFEAQASKDGMDKFLDMIHKMVSKELRTIDDLFAMGHIPDGYEIEKIGGYSEEDINILSKMKRKQLEDAFKSKFGKTDKQVIDEIENESISKLPNDIKKTLEFLNDKYATSITPNDMSDNEIGYHYYMSSPQKMVVNDGANGFSIAFNDVSLKKHGQSLAQLKKFFDHFNIKPSKRPKRRKSLPSLYD